MKSINQPIIGVNSLPVYAVEPAARTRSNDKRERLRRKRDVWPSWARSKCSPHPRLAQQCTHVQIHAICIIKEKVVAWISSRSFQLKVRWTWSNTSLISSLRSRSKRKRSMKTSSVRWSGCSLRSLRNEFCVMRRSSEHPRRRAQKWANRLCTM